MARVAIRARWQRLDPEMMRQLGDVAHRADRRGKVLGVDRAFEARDRDHGVGSLEGRAFGVVRGEAPAPADALEALDLVAGAVGIALDLDEDDTPLDCARGHVSREAQDRPVSVAERLLAAVHRGAGHAHGEQVWVGVVDGQRDELGVGRLSVAADVAGGRAQVGIRDDRAAAREVDDVGLDRLNPEPVG